MLTVADTSALLALASCHRLTLLEAIGLEVIVPAAVYRECTVAGKPGSDLLAAYLAGKVAEHESTAALDLDASGLGSGETAAILLCKQVHGDLLLLDDHRARVVALRHGISVLGSLGVLLRGKELGILSAIKPLILEIQAAGIHYGARLVARALTLAEEA